MRLKKAFGVALAGASTFVAAPASAVVLWTSDFDSHVVDAGGANVSGGPGYDFVNSIDGWTKALAPPAFAPPLRPIEVQNGTSGFGSAYTPLNFIELDSNGNAAMDRTIGAGSYILTYFYSARPGVTLASNGVSVLLNDVVKTGVSGKGGSNIFWNQQQFHFTVGGPTNLKFAAVGTSDSLGGFVDSISLSAIPEPSTWGMLIVGFGVVGASVRRRRSGGSFRTA